VFSFAAWPTARTLGWYQVQNDRNEMVTNLKALLPVVEDGLGKAIVVL
jgi:hypothetical protein